MSPITVEIRLRDSETEESSLWMLTLGEVPLVLIKPSFDEDENMTIEVDATDMDPVDLKDLFNMLLEALEKGEFE